jgi:LysR family transcriptional regulator for metE and metH
VEVRVEVEATSRPVAHLLAGRLDLALVMTPVRDRRLAATPLFRDELLVIAAAGHPLAGRPYVRPEDLADETPLLYSPPSESYVFQKLLTPAHVVPRRVQQVQLTEAIVELVRANLGVAVVARWAMQPYLQAGSLVAVPVTSRGFHRQWSAVVPRGLAHVPYVAEFVRQVAARATVGRSDVTAKPVLRPVRAVG